jgi:transposase InsO family protein
VPAASTVGAILRRRGLVDPAASAAHRPYVRFARAHPNELWQMDFKGHVGMTCGGRCHPLTVIDDHSRFNLVLRACGDERDATVRGALAEAFGRYGQPREVLCDNGPPWGTGYDPLRPYTRLGVWMIGHGILVGHGRPYHRQTQGKDERFHRTLVAEVLGRWTPGDLADAQAAFDAWREVYNHVRPHEALALAAPATAYRPSPRASTGRTRRPRSTRAATRCGAWTRAASSATAAAPTASARRSPAGRWRCGRPTASTA